MRSMETLVLPNLARLFPQVDLTCIIRAQGLLRPIEADLNTKIMALLPPLAFRVAAADGRAPERIEIDLAAVRAALYAAVQFDQHLINHLGEAEELVVPLCLASEACIVHGPLP